MNPYPRIRKTIRWGKYGGAALTVLLVVVWIGSAWWYARFTSRTGHMISVASGRAVFYANLRPYSIFDDVGWAAGTNWYRCEWRVRWTRDSQFVAAEIPLWIPVALLLVACGIAWRLDATIHRRTHLNLCRTCNYDRTGLSSNALCPECGTLPTINQTTQENRHG